MKNKYVYFLNHKQITKSQMLDFIACNLVNDEIQITRLFSMSVANYKRAETKLQCIQRIARQHRHYIAVGYDYVIEVKRNV